MQNYFSLRPLMSDSERDLFSNQLKIASSYFEFGCGGSSVWGIAHGLEVNGVETDLSWINSLRPMLGSRFLVKHIDVGVTGDWGMPLTKDMILNYPSYSDAIQEFSTPFDLILIDGRFRVASLLSSVLHCINMRSIDKSRIFFHDFWNREQYHCVLDFLEVVESVNTTALFKIKEGVDLTLLMELAEKYSCDPT